MELTPRRLEDLRWAAAVLGVAVVGATLATLAAYRGYALIVPGAMLFAALCIVTYHRPAIGVGAGLLLIPSESTGLTGVLSPTEATMAVVGVCYLVRVGVRPHSVIAPALRDLPILAVIAAVAAGLAVADDPSPIYRVFPLWSLFYLVFLQCQTFTEREMRGVLIAFAIGAGILGAIGTYGYLAGGSPQLYSGGLFTGNRAAGAFRDANYSASILSLAVVPAVALLVLEPRRLWWLGVATAAGGAGIIFSLSRGGFLALAAGLAVLLLWGRFRAAAGAIVVAILALALFNADPITQSSQFNAVRQRLGTLTGPQLGQTNLRPRIWSAAVDTGLEHPVFGVGVQNFEKAAAQRAVYERNGAIENVHNLPLNFLAENGFIGFVGFLVFGGQLVARGVRAVRRSGPLGRALGLGLLASLTGFFTQSMTLTPMRVNAIAAAFFVVAGMLTALADRAGTAPPEEAAP